MNNGILGLLEKLLNILTTFIFIAMTVIVFSQVVLRYGFDMNIYWADEFSRFAMIWLTFLGAAIGVKYGEHTRIDFFIKLLPAKGRIFMEVVNKILSIMFVGIISYFSVVSLGGMMSLMTPSMQIPTGILHFVIPITGVIMIIYLMYQTVDIIRNKDEKGDQLI